MDIVITEFTKRTTSIGEVKHTTWDDLVGRLSHPVVTDESQDEYFSMTNEQRTEVKDVGGYVAGEFDGGKRKKDKLKSRCILTIDADDATDHDVDDYEFYDETWLFCVHSTHTSTPDHPRLRWLFLLSRPVTPGEYRRLVKYVSQYVGAETLDETTDQPERLMFWPSISWDADYLFKSGGTEPLDVDSILEKAPEDIAEEAEAKPVITEGKIPVGSRDRAITSYAGTLRHAGLDEDVLYQSVKLYNETYCEDPLPDRDIRRIVRSVCKYEKGDLIPFEARGIESDFGDVGTYVKRGGKNVFIPDIKSQEQIVNSFIPPPSYIIDGFLPIGLGLLVAPAKYRKSWFCLDLAMSVANGTPFLDMPTNQHDVLYCALEDYDYRIKKRSLLVSKDGHTKVSNNLYFAEKMPSLQKGFLDSLEAVLEQYPKVKLVIVDTFIRVKGKTDNNGTAYDIDSDILSPMQEFALDHDLNILLVHHTKKGKDVADFANNINGSMGFNATMDVMLFFNKDKRKDDKAELEVVGRDDKDKTFVVRFDDEKCRWINMGEAKDVHESEAEAAYSNDPVVKTIKFYLKQADDLLGDDEEEDAVWRTTAQGLLDCVERMYGGSEYQNTKALTNHIKEIKDLLEKKDGIRYEYERGSKKREHVFTVERE